MENKLRVVQHVNDRIFCYTVKDEEQAFLLINVLSEYELHLSNIGKIGDDCNSLLWVEMFETQPDGTQEWVNYYNDELDMDWDEYVENHLSKQ
jgi:hypothetical protein